MTIGWDDPDTIRAVARERSAHLQHLREQYRESLEAALERLDKAADEHAQAKSLVSELRAKLAPLGDEIAHLEACAETEAPTLDMLVWKRPKEEP